MKSKSFLSIIIGCCALLSACRAPKVEEGVFGHSAESTTSRKGQEGSTFPMQPGEYIEISNRSDKSGVFAPDLKSSVAGFASAEEVRTFSEGSQSDYKIGPGDRFTFLVRGRQDITRENVVVAPDGLVSLPRVGIFRIEGMTLVEATAYIDEKLAHFYEDAEISLELSLVNNNQVYVLGRVANPGAVHFTGQGTLLEALSLAGGLPADTRLSFLSRCMIVRGNEMLIWVDLRELLEKGNLALNTKLQNGDFIFIPQSEDQLAYVMGEVRRPGVLVLRSEMTVLDAVMGSGGTTINAEPEKVFLVRATHGKGYVTQINLNEMITKGDLRKNFVLEDGDIVYIAPNGLGDLNTFLTQLVPGMRAVDFTINTAEAFGAMAELRNKIWAQEGFINRTSTE